MEASADANGRGFKGLRVYLEAELLAVEVIRVTGKYPENEMFGAVSQSRRAAVSIISNIAEGYRRNSSKDYIRFLKIAYGSCGELEAQMSLASKVGWIEPADYEKIAEMIDTVSRWTWRLMESLGNKRGSRGTGERVI
jgi:four helix bundle protein